MIDHAVILLFRLVDVRDGVDQRALAGVALADDGELHHRGRQAARPLAQALDDGVEHLAPAQAVGGRDEHRLAEAQRRHLGRVAQHLDVVHLVGQQDRSCRSGRSSASAAPGRSSTTAWTSRSATRSPWSAWTRSSSTPAAA